MRVKKALVLLVILALALPGTALAELKRGDRGEGVHELQDLLFHLGWLFEEPDGIFGKKTEAAVKQYQEYVGLRPDGVADDALLQQLEVDWTIARRELYGEEAETVEPPVWCDVSFTGGMLRTLYCAEHREALRRSESSWYDGPAAMRDANDQWEELIEELGIHMQLLAGPERQLDYLAARASWTANAQTQRFALEAALPDSPERVEELMNLLFKARAALLCGVCGEGGGLRYEPLEEDEIEPDGRYEEAPVDDDGMEAQPLDDDEYGCVYWAENLGTEYVSLCPVHAELAWRLSKIDVSDPAALQALLSDWEADLDGLYGLWAESLSEDDAPAVRDAQAAFDTALAGLLRLSADADEATTLLRRLNAVMNESLRLCALTHDTDIY